MIKVLTCGNENDYYDFNEKEKNIQLKNILNSWIWKWTSIALKYNVGLSVNINMISDKIFIPLQL